MNSLKISIDIDETLTSHMEFFITLAMTLKRWGHRVGILSGRASKDIPAGPWDFVISGDDPDTQRFPNDHDKAKEWKSKMIRDNGIDIHFDDMADWILEGDVGNSKVVKVI